MHYGNPDHHVAFFANRTRLKDWLFMCMLTINLYSYDNNIFDNNCRNHDDGRHSNVSQALSSHDILHTNGQSEVIAFVLMPKAQSFTDLRVYAVDTFGDELRETLSPLDYNE